ncbi:hypothetical protein BCEP4_990011 [Burkholderia cepacia]|nr:hypothetical protein BCEP4_990011 [Burkholderia cepacia]
MFRSGVLYEVGEGIFGSHAISTRPSYRGNHVNNSLVHQICLKFKSDISVNSAFERR